MGEEGPEEGRVRSAGDRGGEEGGESRARGECEGELGGVTRAAVETEGGHHEGPVFIRVVIVIDLRICVRLFDSVLVGRVGARNLRNDLSAIPLPLQSIE